jgi:phage tail-like protein
MGVESREKCFTNQFDTDLCDDVVAIRNLTMRFPKIASTDSGDVKYKTWNVGNPDYGIIEFEGLAHKDTIGDIKDWVKECYNGTGNVTRKDLSVNVRKHQQETPMRAFNLIGCYPLAFNYCDIGAGDQGSNITRWTLSVRVQQVNIA